MPFKSRYVETGKQRGRISNYSKFMLLFQPHYTQILPFFNVAIQKAGEPSWWTDKEDNCILFNTQTILGVCVCDMM